MKRLNAKQLAVAAATIICATSFSVDWSRDNGASMSINSAQARVGRPLTPVSVAGVARRTTRRTVRRNVYGAGAACVQVYVNGAYVCRY